MSHVVLMSCECPGIAPGLQKLGGSDVSFLLLSGGQSLSDRVAKCSIEERLATIAIVSLLTDELGREQLSLLKSRLPNLQLIANYAVGYNNIDGSAAKELGIRVSNTPHVLGEATADLTLALMLMVARRIWPGALEIHQQGRFAGWSPHYGLGVDLGGKTLGIVGWGDIGRRVEVRAQALGMKVVALESLRPIGQRSESVSRLPEREFLAAVDVLSLHCPLTPATRGWLNALRVSALKKGAMVINTARGDVVDEQALAEALRSGHLFGAGIDVFCGEPIVSPVLRGVPNLVILPHLGSATIETRSAMGKKVLENISALMRGQSLLPSQVHW
ncbi:D-glycerate dehydrogenase [bacterium]|nr:D-glycerate dehydrogenase [bacterium]